MLASEPFEVPHKYIKIQASKRMVFVITVRSKATEFKALQPGCAGCRLDVKSVASKANKSKRE